MSTTRFFVYILVCSDGAFYVGQTDDLEARVQAHLVGTGAVFTKNHQPLKLVYTEPLPTRQLAMRRERQIKGWTRAKKEALIRGDWDQLHRLSRRRTKPTITDHHR